MSNSLSIKIFVGTLINSELEFLLNRSHSWQIERIDSSFLEVMKDNKKFLGFFLTEATLPEIEKTVSAIKHNLLLYIPGLNTEELLIQIFAQFF
jgi:hypothetical protein